MAGKIHKGFMFQPWFWLRLVPDLPTVRAFLPHFLTRQRDCKDDTLLLRVVQLFAAAGIELGPASDYAPELLVQAGPISRRGPTPGQWKDIRFGWTIAKEIGRLDIGQSVAVKNQAVLAVEAVEGTDQCIRRAGDALPGRRKSRSSRWPSRSRTCGSTCRPSARARWSRWSPPAPASWPWRPAARSSSTRPKLIALADRHKLVLVALDRDRLGMSNGHHGGANRTR